MRRNTAVANESQSPQSAVLRDQIISALERLSEYQNDFAHAETAPPHDTWSSAQFLSEVLAALDELHHEALPAEGAGFGATVLVRDQQAGTEQSYTLMTGPMLDIDAGHVSLASPIGRALLGSSAGDVVIVDTPQRRMYLQVVAVCTLSERITERVPANGASTGTVMSQERSGC